MGWGEWPLDFSESSDWPAFWRMVPVHMEKLLTRAELSRRPFGWPQGEDWSFTVEEKWGREAEYLPKPTVEEVEAGLMLSSSADAMGGCLVQLARYFEAALETAACAQHEASTPAAAGCRSFDALEMLSGAAKGFAQAITPALPWSRTPCFAESLGQMGARCKSIIVTRLEMYRNVIPPFFPSRCSRGTSHVYILERWR